MGWKATANTPLGQQAAHRPDLGGRQDCGAFADVREGDDRVAAPPLGLVKRRVGPFLERVRAKGAPVGRGGLAGHGDGEAAAHRRPA